VEEVLECLVSVVSQLGVVIDAIALDIAIGPSTIKKERRWFRPRIKVAREIVKVGYRHWILRLCKGLELLGEDLQTLKILDNCPKSLVIRQSHRRSFEPNGLMPQR